MSSSISDNCCETNDSINQFEENIESSSILNSLNLLHNRLNNISINELKFIQNLEEWNCQSHQLIDQFCKDISSQFFNQTKEKIDHLQNTIDLMINNYNENQDYI